MRKRIWRMSEDQFELPTPEITYSQDAVTIKGYSGKRLEGEFEIRSTNDVSMKGVCYSTNPYVVVSNPQFEGTLAVIRYSLLNTGFCAGDEITGSFCIVANGREDRLPFKVEILHRFPESSIGPIDSMEKFVLLAREHWNEAMQLFFSDRFSHFVSSGEESMALLYRGYRRAVPSSLNLEEFLIAIGAKRPVTFSLDESDRTFTGLTENLRETIEITKSDWGHIEIDVSSDADFVTIEKERITSDFFVGSGMQLSFYIHKNKMHAGKNYARITFRSVTQSKEIRICASRIPDIEDAMPPSLLHKKRLVKLVRFYEDYRREMITSLEWAKESVNILNFMIEEEAGDKTLYELMKAQALIVGGGRQEALLLIQKLRKSIENKKSREWAYLLYLCTLIEKEEAYVDRLTREIELIFLEQPDDPMIFWFLLFLRREYIGDTRRKLVAIRQWILAGYATPYLYIEAYYLLCQDPYLFSEFDEFTLQLTRWMLSKKCMNEKLAQQFIHVFEGQRIFKQELYDLATGVYRVFPANELLVDITTWLLKNHKYGEDYLPWYRESIAREMNFTGLYEAYVLSLPGDSMEKLPLMVVMYFRYQNTLPAEKKAYVYANVITHHKDEFKIYDGYIKNIERFALEEMRLGRMDDNLAIIYDHVFLERQLLDPDVADQMGRLLFYQKLIILRDDVPRIIVYEKPLANPQIVPVEDHVAYVPIFTSDYRIFLEDKRGHLFTDPRGYMAEPLMNVEKTYEKLRSLARRRFGYFLHDLNGKHEAADYSYSEVEDVGEFLSSDQIDPVFRRSRYRQMVDFLKSCGREDLLQKHFLSLTDYDGLDSATMSYVIDLHIIDERYEKAFDLMREYNGSGVPGKSLLTLVGERIRVTDERVDDFLIALTTQLMRKFLSSEDTIRYMNRFFIGPTGDMMTLWQFAYARQLDTRALEERIITQMLYTENIDVTSEAIFSEYLNHHPSRMLKDAYLMYWSHKYLVTKEKVPESVFAITADSFLKEEHLGDSAAVALMKHLCEKQTLTDDEFKVLDGLMSQSMLKNITFGFFKKTDRRLVVKYHIYDKLFAEYEGRPRMRLVIRCREEDGEWEEKEMIEMYPGIYVRQFVVFFGETFAYEIYERGKEEEILKSDLLTFDAVLDRAPENRYEFINQMESAFVYFDEKKLLSEMKEYERLKRTTEILFSML